MATTAFLSPVTAHASSSRSPFIVRSSSHQPWSTISFPAARRAESRGSNLCTAPCAKKSPLDRVPKRFREDNLPDGLKENYQNVPRSLYGLNPSQLAMFMTEDNMFSRQSSRVTEESISSARAYAEFGGVLTTKGWMNAGLSPYSMSYSSVNPNAEIAKLREEPPDLPSLMLDSRVIYLGMPIVPEVSELLVAQFLWLGYDDDTKPMYLYINSPGTQNDKKESVALETEAYAVADAMLSSNSVYTVNIARAYGQAAMLLSLGQKGHRGVLPGASTRLHLPSVHRSSGAVSDMWIKAEELSVEAQYYIDLVSQGTGRPKEEIAEYIQRPRYFNPQNAVDYGLADRIIYSLEGSFTKKEYEVLEQERKARQETGVVPKTWLE